MKMSSFNVGENVCVKYAYYTLTDVWFTKTRGRNKTKKAHCNGTNGTKRNRVQISPVHPGGENNLSLSIDFVLHEGSSSLLSTSKQQKNAQKLPCGGMNYKKGKKPQTTF